MSKMICIDQTCFEFITFQVTIIHTGRVVAFKLHKAQRNETSVQEGSQDVFFKVKLLLLQFDTVR